jgi:hypothetical protein
MGSFSITPFHESVQPIDILWDNKNPAASLTLVPILARQLHDPEAAKQFFHLFFP